MKISMGKKYLIVLFALALMLGVIAAAYATAPAGVSTHSTLYADTIAKKSVGDAITVNNRLIVGGITNGISAQATGASGVGVSAQGTGTSSIGVYALGTAYGVSGYSSTPGSTGVKASGVTYGVDATATSGIGVKASGVTYGVDATATSGIGVKATGKSYGVEGIATGTSGVGVRGTGATKGVYGESTAINGVAIFGVSNAADSIAVLGQSLIASGGTGVYGTGSLYGVQAMGTKCDFNAHGPGKDLCANGADVAEYFTASNNLEPGDVVVIDTSNIESIKKSTKAYDPLAAGIVSTDPSIALGFKDDNTGKKPLALAGRVPVKASAENGPIKIGDLLTTSNTAGYAMRCDDRTKCAGAIIGKALEPLANGKGKISVLVVLG